MRKGEGGNEATLAKEAKEAKKKLKRGRRDFGLCVKKLIPFSLEIPRSG